MRIPDLYRKTTSFWQTLLRVGIPFAVLYRTTDYLAFLVRIRHSPSHFLAWYVFVPTDATVAVILSAAWSGVMRSVFRYRRESIGR